MERHFTPWCTVHPTHLLNAGTWCLALPVVNFLHTVETKDHNSPEVAKVRLELVNKSVLACSEYLVKIENGLPSGDAFERLTNHLQELARLFVSQPNVRGIERYIASNECRKLLSLLKKLPPADYEQLDQLVGLPGESWLARAGQFARAFKDMIVFGPKID